MTTQSWSSASDAVGQLRDRADWGPALPDQRVRAGSGRHGRIYRPAHRDIVGTDLGVLLHRAGPGTTQAADGHEVSQRTGRDAGKGSC